MNKVIQHTNRIKNDFLHLYSSNNVTSLSFYGGINEIGGNKFLLEDKKPVGFDFSKLSDRGLKDLVLDPENGFLAKTIFENRGNYVHIKNGKVMTRKKPR